MKKIKNLIANFKSKIITKLKDITIKITKSDKWKIYLYLNGQCVKKIYVDEEFKPMENFYIVKVKNLKHIIGTNRKTKIMLRYYKYKLTDNDKKEVHIETLVYEGSDLTV